MDTLRDRDREMNAILIRRQPRVNGAIGSDKHSVQFRCLISLRKGVLVGLHMNLVASLDLAGGGDRQAWECFDRELCVASGAGLDLSEQKGKNVSGCLRYAYGFAC